ncbi:protein ACCELERATED CELL DEATH 6-like [Prosopis cineraria]|uniref:protein ACCELERATED CELL DEATH 6-like n=1 Tax=Prosopis cineraria TaxID=364024 RepID=UPI00240EF0B0|nr:protein ACCELERATED CELL DEATH 6-like [Prosopis cineraria]
MENHGETNDSDHWKARCSEWIISNQLYEEVRDENEDVDGFVRVLEEVCHQRRLELSTIFNQVASTGDLLLHVAAKFGKVERNMNGDALLHVAAKASNIEAIKVILFIDEHIIKPRLGQEANFIMSRNIYGNTALHEAVLSKHDGVRFLLKAHSECDDLASYWTWSKKHSRKSPKYLAVEMGNVEIIDLLLKIPFPLILTFQRETPLLAAISDRNLDVLQEIVNIGEELLYQGDETKNTPLHYASYRGYVEVVDRMLEKSTLIAFQRNSDGNLPIQLASIMGSINVVKKLLDKAFDSGACLNGKGQNNLHIAAMNGRNKMIECLLRRLHWKAVNEKDVNGNTPLHLASKKLQLLILRNLLLDQHIDVNLVNNQGSTSRDCQSMYSSPIYQG